MSGLFYLPYLEDLRAANKPFEGWHPLNWHYVALHPAA